MLLLALLACRAYEIPEGATAYDWDVQGPLNTFPDDLHTVAADTITGRRVELTPEARAELEPRVPPGFSLLTAFEALDGWGTTSAVVLRFTAPLDPASISGDTIRWERESDGAPVAWDASLTDEGATILLLPRVPLEPETGYRVVADGLRDESGGEVWASADLHELIEGKLEGERVESLIPRYAGLEEADAAVVFTTQSIFRDDEVVLGLIDANPPSLTMGACEDEGARLACEATLTAIDVMGEDEILAPMETPSVQRVVGIPVSIWVPKGVGPHPVVIYGHGLGGERGEGGGLAGDLADLGVAVVAIDAPSHGQHPIPGDGDLFSILDYFGVDLTEGTFDVERLRDHWRHAAWDKVQLVRAMRGGLDVDGDGAADLDGDRIGYSGHSLGGIMGPPLLAMEPDLLAGELSVPGGRVSEIVQYGQTFSLLVEAMRPDGVSDGDVDRFFPMVQAAIDRGDTANYAPRVLGGERDVLVQLVLDDDIIPNSTTQFLARSLGVDLAPPVHLPIDGLVTLGALPVSGNRDGRTAVIYEFADMLDEDGVTRIPATHTHIHGNPVGVAQLRHFWATRLESGVAEVIDPWE